MGLIRDRSRRTAPIQMLILGLVLIGLQAYLAAGSAAAQFMVGFSLKKLLIQVPAGIVAVWIASRFIDFDFGTIGGIALKIAAITVLAEGVGCWIPIPFFSIMAELTVMLVGFFLLFELSKWQTYLIVLLNFIVLFGAHYLLANYINPSRSFGSRPQGRVADSRNGEPTPTAVLCDDRESGPGERSLSRTAAPTRGSATERLVSVDVDMSWTSRWMGSAT
jgi:hypothetical protein